MYQLCENYTVNCTVNELTNLLIGGVLVNMLAIDGIVYSQYSKNGTNVFVVFNSEVHPCIEQIDEQAFFDAYSTLQTMFENESDETNAQLQELLVATKAAEEASKNAETTAKAAETAAEAAKTAAEVAKTAAKALQEATLVASSGSVMKTSVSSLAFLSKKERARRFGYHVNTDVSHMLDLPLDEMIPEHENEEEHENENQEDHDDCNGDSVHDPELTKEQLDKELDKMVLMRKKHQDDDGEDNEDNGENISVSSMQFKEILREMKELKARICLLRR